LGIKVTRETCTLKLQTLAKETKEEINKWKNIPCSMTRPNIIKIAIFSKLRYTFNAMPVRV
jgi:hypothetical protein